MRVILCSKSTSSPGSPFSLFLQNGGARREDPGVGCSIKGFDWLLRKILRIALIGYYDIKMVDYYILFCIFGNITRVIFIFSISDKGLNSEVLIALTCKLVTSKDHSKVTVMKCKVTSKSLPSERHWKNRSDKNVKLYTVKNE